MDPCASHSLGCSFEVYVEQVLLCSGRIIVGHSHYDDCTPGDTAIVDGVILYDLLSLSSVAVSW